MSKQEPKNPRIVLEEDHRHVSALLDRLVACVRADDREAAATAWSRMEKALLKHLDVEEMFVFPALLASHREEVEGLLREHAVLRRELGVLGLAIDLHAARAEAIEAFCAVLREHAARESSLAYAQVEQRLTVNIARAIVDRIAAAVNRKRTPRRPAPIAGASS
jgi:hypothetical protein